MKCSVRILAGAVMLVTLAGCNTTKGPTATEPLGYAEATGSIDPIDPLPPIRPVKKHVFLLMGGLDGGDGSVDQRRHVRAAVVAPGAAGRGADHLQLEVLQGRL